MLGLICYYQSTGYRLIVTYFDSKQFSEMVTRATWCRLDPIVVSAENVFYSFIGCLQFAPHAVFHCSPTTMTESLVEDARPSRDAHLPAPGLVTILVVIYHNFVIPALGQRSEQAFMCLLRLPLMWHAF